MKLEEAIKHCEEVAEEQDMLCKRYDDASGYSRSGIESLRREDAKKCLECASEHRQLAEWLKELKQLREQTRWIPVSERLPNNHECIKNNGLFNVSDGNRSYFGWFDIYDTKKFVKPTIAGFCVDNAVIAWMPLPEPCKAESDKEVNTDGK